MNEFIRTRNTIYNLQWASNKFSVVENKNNVTVTQVLRDMQVQKDTNTCPQNDNWQKNNMYIQLSNEIKQNHCAENY